MARPKKIDVASERAEAQAGLKSELEKQHGEPHYWITFNRMGDNDKVDNVYIGAAGVSYNIRKGERVLLPHSAIQALKLAVREGLDHGNPVQIAGRKFLRKIRESDYSYTIEGQVSAEEAAEWRADMRRRAKPEGDLVPIDGGEEEMVDIGAA